MNILSTIKSNTLKNGYMPLENGAGNNKEKKEKKVKVKEKDTTAPAAVAAGK